MATRMDRESFADWLYSTTVSTTIMHAQEVLLGGHHARRHYGNSITGDSSDSAGSALDVTLGKRDDSK